MDPRFKALRIVENLVGCGNVIQLASKYDVKVVPLLMVCFGWLNPIAITFVAAIDFVGLKLELEENIFGVGASIEKSFKTLITKNLFLFRKHSIPSSACANPLTWWQMYEGQFPNVAFYAKQILGIPVSQIEIKEVLNLVGVLITLRCCHLQVENMDWIVIVVKSWPNDPHANCKPQSYLK
jgi:hypothetical protein